MVIRLVTILCLAVLSLELLYVLVNIALKKRPNRIAFIRGFKKGRFAIIYPIAIPLYTVGRVYAGLTFSDSLFKSVSDTIGLVLLKYETESIQELFQADALYRFTIRFCFVLVILNALLFTISLTGQYVWSWFQAFRMRFTHKKRLFILGYNPDNVSIFRSDRERRKLLIDSLSDGDREKLYMDRVAFRSRPLNDVTVRKLFRILDVVDRENVLIVNTGDDEKNVLLCRAVIDCLRQIDEAVRKELFEKTRVYVFGDPRYETIYDDVVSAGFGCIRYINKYQIVAMDFIDKYPLTKFMDETQIDYDTSLIREGVEINVVLIGFGKTNRQIFLTSVANNQFLTAGETDPVLKQVSYLIIDKDEADNNKNLNHNYYRFEIERDKYISEAYLPFPSLPAKNEPPVMLDVNDRDFYKTIRSAVTRDPRDANFIIIAFGSDLENLDMAHKLVEKRKEWNVENLVIFVKVREWHKEQTLLKAERCYFIGNESEVVFNVDKILGDRIFRMARMRNEVYDLEYRIKHDNPVISDEYVRGVFKDADRDWYLAKTQWERESSLYCCLSLRSKLNLMGLDYAEDDGSGEPALSEEEYLALYAGDDLPDTEFYRGVTANGKPIVHYTLDFARSRRRNMAILEHQRWNSFMISKGMVPASIEQIKNETIEKNGKVKHTNGKNYALRRHGCLTTFEGLVKFRKLVAESTNCDEAEADVINYDYQLLDDAFWLLSSNGFKIVRNKKLD